jgi:hypothetical protein
MAAAGPLVLRWDGSDDAGHPAAPGLYFARARFGSSEARARFVRLR